MGASCACRVPGLYVPSLTEDERGIRAVDFIEVCLQPLGPRSPVGEVPVRGEWCVAVIWRVLVVRLSINIDEMNRGYVEGIPHVARGSGFVVRHAKPVNVRAEVTKLVNFGRRELAVG